MGDAASMFVLTFMLTAALVSGMTTMTNGRVLIDSEEGEAERMTYIKLMDFWMACMLVIPLLVLAMNLIMIAKPGWAPGRLRMLTDDEWVERASKFKDGIAKGTDEFIESMDTMDRIMFEQLAERSPALRFRGSHRSSDAFTAPLAEAPLRALTNVEEGDVKQMPLQD